MRWGINTRRSVHVVLAQADADAFVESVAVPSGEPPVNLCAFCSRLAPGAAMAPTSDSYFKTMIFMFLDQRAMFKKGQSNFAHSQQKVRKCHAIFAGTLYFADFCGMPAEIVKSLLSNISVTFRKFIWINCVDLKCFLAKFRSGTAKNEL